MCTYHIQRVDKLAMIILTNKLSKLYDPYGKYMCIPDIIKSYREFAYVPIYQTDYKLTYLGEKLC